MFYCERECENEMLATKIKDMMTIKKGKGENTKITEFIELR